MAELYPEDGEDLIRQAMEDGLSAEYYSIYSPGFLTLRLSRLLKQSQVALYFPRGDKWYTNEISVVVGFSIALMGKKGPLWAARCLFCQHDTPMRKSHDRNYLASLNGHIFLTPSMREILGSALMLAALWMFFSGKEQ